MLKKDLLGFGSLLGQFLDGLEVLVDASVKKVIVIGSPNHEDFFFFEGHASKSA